MSGGRLLGLVEPDFALCFFIFSFSPNVRVSRTGQLTTQKTNRRLPSVGWSGC